MEKRVLKTVKIWKSVKKVNFKRVGPRVKINQKSENDEKSSKMTKKQEKLTIFDQK